jgi:hypothetical protein
LSWIMKLSVACVFYKDPLDRTCRNVCSVMAVQRRVSADNHRQATDDDGREETANGHWVSHECEIGVIYARAAT